ncbi:MAG: DsbC family protein [Proteobacteria bacterium]|nr:DsbC family protein [Pseudomonadota bacterium]MBU1687316.1 DsbC family protein [Pseudomonadota bacterium]
MNRKIRLLSLCFLLLLLLPAGIVSAFTKDGCGDGECRSCHQLSKQDAAQLLAVEEKNIVDLKMSEVPGLWEIDLQEQEKVIPLFMDFSKQYLISGSVIKIDNRQNITQERFVDLNRIDVGQIPLEDALLIGKPTAKNRIIIFDDPQCPYCAKLQKELRGVVNKRPDIAFYIKMFPLASHPEAYARAKAIVCANSLAMLEDSLAGKSLAPPTCETDRIEKNLALAASIGIRSTPTLILPDGRVLPGYKSAEDIIRLLEKPISKENNISN